MSNLRDKLRIPFRSAREKPNAQGTLTTEEWEMFKNATSRDPEVRPSRTDLMKLLTKLEMPRSRLQEMGFTEPFHMLGSFKVYVTENDRVKHRNDKVLFNLDGIFYVLTYNSQSGYSLEKRLSGPSEEPDEVTLTQLKKRTPTFFRDYRIYAPRSYIPENRGRVKEWSIITADLLRTWLTKRDHDEPIFIDE